MTTDQPKTITALFRTAVTRQPDGDALRYFDGRLSYAALDRDSDALAAALQDRGIRAGDRIMLWLQNVPAFVIATVAAAKIGAIIVPINPMYREREVALLLADCKPALLICLDRLAREVAALLPIDDRPPLLAVSPADRQTRNDPRVMTKADLVPAEGVERFDGLISAWRGQAPQPVDITGDAIASLIYTSGTTGAPKGVMNSHANLWHGGRVYDTLFPIEASGPLLALAPLFHITGIAGHIVAAFHAASPLILAYRFEAAAMLDAIDEHRPHYTVGAITALTALINHQSFARSRFASFHQIMSGGAPIPPALHTHFHEQTGLWLRNAYGLTETSGPITVAPSGEAPSETYRIDPASASLSVGREAIGTRVTILDELGHAMPPGAMGEITATGALIARGYWNKPAETAATMRPEGLRTGDIGFADADGWIYLVDRIKDMIIASGFKVWPREVEDVLYTHPAVREAAVVGVPDSYRGETVKAVVSLRPGSAPSPDELIDYCRVRMAAYKYPRILEIVDEIPKTPTGKILRREFRSKAS